MKTRASVSLLWLLFYSSLLVAETEPACDPSNIGELDRGICNLSRYLGSPARFVNNAFSTQKNDEGTLRAKVTFGPIILEHDVDWATKVTTEISLPNLEQKLRFRLSIDQVSGNEGNETQAVSGRASFRSKIGQIRTHFRWQDDKPGVRLSYRVKGQQFWAPIRLHNSIAPFYDSVFLWGVGGRYGFTLEGNNTLGLDNSYKHFLPGSPEPINTFAQWHLYYRWNVRNPLTVSHGYEYVKYAPENTVDNHWVRWFGLSLKIESASKLTAVELGPTLHTNLKTNEDTRKFSILFSVLFP